MKIKSSKNGLKTLYKVYVHLAFHYIRQLIYFEDAFWNKPSQTVIFPSWLCSILILFNSLNGIRKIAIE